MDAKSKLFFEAMQKNKITMNVHLYTCMISFQTVNEINVRNGIELSDDFLDELNIDDRCINKMNIIKKNEIISELNSLKNKLKIIRTNTETIQLNNIMLLSIGKEWLESILCLSNSVKIGEVFIRLNQDKLNFPLILNDENKNLILKSNGFLTSNFMLSQKDMRDFLAFSKEPTLPNVDSKSRTAIMTISKSIGIVPFLFKVITFLALIGLAFGNTNCVTSNIVDYHYPYCDNETRIGEVNSRINEPSLITCLDSTYANLQYSTDRSFAIPNYEAYVSGNASPFIYAICRQSGVWTTYCHKSCNVSAFYDSKSSVSNETFAKCIGDSNWNNSNNAYSNKTILFPECFCTTYRKLSVTIGWRAGNSEYCKPSATGLFNISFNKPFNLNTIKHHYNRYQKAHIEIEGRNVIATTRENCSCYLHIYKDGFTALSEFSGNEARAYITDVMMIKGGPLYVTIIDSDGHEEEFIFKQKGDEFCAKGCTFCFWELFTNFHCLSWYAIVIWIIIYLIAIFLIFALVFKSCESCMGCCFSCMVITHLLILFILYLLSALFCCFPKIQSRINTSINRRKEKVSEAKELNETLITKKLDNLEERQGVKMKSRFNFFGMSICLIVLISCLIDSTLAQDFTGCTETTSITSVTRYCDKVYPQRANCSVTFTDNIVFNSVKDKLCRQIKDSSNRIIGTLVITLTSSEYQIALNKLYYTSDYHVVIDSRVRCHSELSHCRESWCKATQTRMATINGENQLSKYEIFEFPGQTECSLDPYNSANEFCGEVSEVCTYKGYAIVPKGKIFLIYEPMAQKRIFTLKVDYTTGNYNTTYYVQTSNSWNSFGNLNLIVNDLNLKETIDFENYKLITTADNHYLARANEVNVFDMKQVGDIQSNTAEGLSYGTSDFAYDPKNYVFTGAGKDVSVVFDDPPLSSSKVLNSFLELPTNYAGFIWTFDPSGYLRTNVSEGVTFTLKTNNNFTFTDFVSTVCPKVIDVANVSGCYNCPIGSSFEIKMKSVCDEGIVSLETNDDSITLQTTSLYLKKEEISFVVNFLTTKQNNDFDVDVVGTNGKVKFNVNYVASDYNEVIGDNTQDTVNTDPENPISSKKGESFWSKFKTEVKDFFEGHFGIFTWLIAAIVMLIVLGVIVMFVKKYKKNKQDRTLIVSKL